MAPARIDLRGRRAIVTGGARGIGRAIAERFLQSGAAVALWDQDAAGAKAAAADLSGLAAGGGPVHVEALDIVDAAAVEAALQATEAAQGPSDILVTSAGITGPNATVADYDPAAWRRVIDVDLYGVYACLRAVVPGMQSRGYGRIVNIASVAGKEGNPNASAYSAAKAGVIALTKSLGKELAETGVLVNAVAPAVIETELFAQMTEAHIAYMISKIPMNRVGQPHEVAALVTWLASEECSFSTGATFDLSGGRATY
ncbi:MAG: SDR family NAD(P)-dependent oxidoreductase [Sneathiellaceae bacterium]